MTWKPSSLRRKKSSISMSSTSPLLGDERASHKVMKWSEGITIGQSRSMPGIHWATIVSVPCIPGPIEKRTKR